MVKANSGNVYVIYYDMGPYCNTAVLEYILHRRWLAIGCGDVFRWSGITVSLSW